MRLLTVKDENGLEVGINLNSVAYYRIENGLELKVFLSNRDTITLGPDHAVRFLAAVKCDHGQ